MNLTVVRLFAREDHLSTVFEEIVAKPLQTIIIIKAIGILQSVSDQVAPAQYVAHPRAFLTRYSI